MVGVLAAAAPLVTRPMAAQLDNQPDGSRYQVYLMTMGPGELIEERFGHNAIWIRDTVAGTDRLYNFGMFDYNQPNFYWNFTKGRPEYWLDVWSLEGTLRVYASRQRTVEVQELALTAAQKAELAASLAENADPSNRAYRYDYYLDNCSTRVRDALDRVLGGALRASTESRSGEGSYRFHTQRSITNNPWLYLGILAAMGPRADQRLNMWDEMFLPEKVQDRVRELRVRDESGREVPLVIRESTLLQFDAWHVEPAPPNWSPRLLGIGVLMALVIATGSLRGFAGAPGRVLGGVLGVVLCLGGALLLFLALFTNHVMTDWNGNVLLFTPLAVLIPFVMAGKGGRAARVLLAAAVAGASLWGVVAFVVPAIQEAREVVALLLPPILASGGVALLISRRRAAAPSAPR